MCLHIFAILVSLLLYHQVVLPDESAEPDPLFQRSDSEMETSFLCGILFPLFFFSMSKFVDDARHDPTVGFSLGNMDMRNHMRRISVMNF